MYLMPATICHHCGETIKEGEERAIAIVIGIPKAFCKCGDNPEVSCWFLWNQKKKRS